MKNKIALVTGGAHGIGRAVAARLAADAKVFFVDIDVATGKQTEDELRAQDLDVSFLAGDVASNLAVISMAEHIRDEYGRLDWLVNNAGVSHFQTLADTTAEEFDRVLAVNLRSAFLFAKHFANLLAVTGSGAIVNIASTRALMSEPGNEAYAASKAGLLGLTHALANSLGPAVRVNAICPGWIDVSDGDLPISEQEHAQHLTGRAGTPQDIAETVSFLLSSAAAFITGQYIVADGGMTKKMIYR